MFPTQLRQYIFLLLAGIYLGVSQGQQQRDNYQLYTVFAVNDSQIGVLRKLQRQTRAIIPAGFHCDKESTKVFVLQNETSEFTEAMDYAKISYNLSPAKLGLPPLHSTEIYDFHRYHDLPPTYEWMRNMERKFDLSTEIIKLGTTHENRDIYAFYINEHRSDHDIVRNRIVISAGVYGNEWITTATAIYIINELLTSRDENVKKVAEAYDWIIVPFLNPDGYVYSFNTDRLWFNNRREYVGCCPGVDINRAFYDMKYYFKTTKNIEPEINALAKVFSMFDSIDLYISLEAGKPSILYPQVLNETDAKKGAHIVVAQTAVDALAEVYGTKYKRIKNTGHDEYSRDTSSGSMDWVHRTHDALAFAYKLDLGDESADAIGGTVPVTKILPTAIEIFHSVVAMVNKVQKMGLFPHRYHHT